MIDVTVLDLNDGFHADVSGHAGFAPKGQDIVCAGVSALSDALVRMIELYRPELNSIKLNINEGWLSLAVESLSGMTLKAMEAAFMMFYFGVKGIADEYPEHVRIAYYEYSEKGFVNKDTSEQTMNNE